MAKAFDPYEDFPEEEDDYDLEAEEIARFKELQRDNRRKAAMRDTYNDIGRIMPITAEAAERKLIYRENYPLAHQEVFTQSTGIKPFGPGQLESIKRTHHVLKHGGRSVIAEPRGIGKTSRTSNNALLGVLQGYVKYVLILASSVQKAEDILESIKTELIDNEQLYQLYPEICECFRHGADSFNRSLRQTYKGERTYIGYTKHMIRMPVIPGEPSSGSIIQVRSKDNVRGLSVKVRYGEDSGRVLRPDFVFMDDIQTDEEAQSPTSVYKIVQTIKKSVLFAGSHSKRVSAVMCCTPICAGDVSSHFILKEPSWDCIVSPLVKQMPTNIDKWLTEYSNILLDFDRYQTGSRLQAQLRAKKYVEENYDLLHEGSDVCWDWAYGWAEDPQTEVSALHHAMNFRIEEGEEAFESECQCNVMEKVEEAEGVKATLDEIVSKVHPFPRYRCPVETNFVVTHIDVNQNVLSYVTMGSPKDFRPMILDYGTWPEQPGVLWRKRDLTNSLERHYRNIPEVHERLYLGIKHLVNKLGHQKYIREDNLVMTNNLIMVDMGYAIDEVQRAIRESDYRNITCCARGQGIGAKGKQFMERHYEKHAEKHFHCATVPTTDRTLTAVYMDVNYFKTLFHKGIKTRLGLGGSISTFTPERSGMHLMYGTHCSVEVPTDDYSEDDNRHVITWSNPKKEDNEYFDNAVGCIAGLFKLGCEIRGQKRSGNKSYDIGEYLYGG